MSSNLNYSYSYSSIGIIITILIIIMVIGYNARIYNYYYLLSIKGTINEHKIIKNRENLSKFTVEKILTKDQANMFANRVRKDRKLWKYKNIVMSILGTASYIEGTKGFDYYRKEYLKTNKILKSRYSDLFDILLNYFRKRTGKDNVKFKFALPGFHIFECNTVFSLPVASIHQDFQYLNVEFDQKVKIDYNKTASFTLCLELPKTGGGLYVFGDEQVKVSYTPGYIACHNGKTNHMIASSPVSHDEDNPLRITLQAHSLYDKLSDTWFVYW